MKSFKEQLSEITSELVQRANFFLPPDVYNAIEEASVSEHGIAKAILSILLANARLASENKMPICQDTGIDAVFLEAGPDICIDHQTKELIDQGIARGTADGFLRASVCDPITRQNTRDNTPSVFHVKHVSKPGLRLKILPKGCGSENMSALLMLPPSKGVNGIIEAIINQVQKAGPNACPPGIIGVGIGGTLEQAALLSKEALLRPFGVFHQRQDIASLEQRIIKGVNALGIGPHGFGGAHTTLHAAVELFPCHIASLPLAINLQCHAARTAEAVWRSDKWTLISEEKPPKDTGAEIDFSNFLPTRLTLPISEEISLKLKAGDWALLNGTVFTARDQTHRRLCELIERNMPLPVDLRDALIYYVGPSPAKPGAVIGSAGPTTSYRMDAYTPKLLSKGIRGTIGKGKRSPEVIKAMASQKALYFATIGGAGAYLARCIKSCELVAFPELGTEAMYRLDLENFPVIVINDINGNDFYENARKPIGIF